MLLSEMFGVERYTPFMVKDLVSVYIIGTDDEGIERIERVDEGASKSEVVYGPSAWRVINAAPSGIIHLPPPLSDKQREQLKALYTLGYFLLAMDKNGEVFAYSKNIHKCGVVWTTGIKRHVACIDEKNPITNLVSWSDTEPYDIAKALGVEG